MIECNDEANCTCRHCEEVRQAVLREVRDVLVYCRDGFDDKLEVDERLFFDHHVLRWFRKYGRFEVKEGE